MSERGIRIGLAVAGAALLLLGVLSKSWWTKSVLGTEVNVGLRTVQFCGNGVCRELPWQLVGGRTSLFGAFANLTYFIGIAAASLLLIGAFLRETQDIDSVGVAASSVSVSVIPMSLLAAATFPGELELSWSLWVTLGGAVCGALSQLSGFGRTGWDGRTYVPLSKPESPSGGDPYRHVAAPAQPAPTARAVAPQDAASVADAVRFVAKQCQLTSAGLDVQTRRDQRLVPWTEVTKVCARRLPVDPPFDKTILVDIAVRGGGPIRLLPTTHVNYNVLPGSGTTSTENFRRFGRYVHERLPELIEPESVPFFCSDEPPPEFASAGQFADYDSQYDS